MNITAANCIYVRRKEINVYDGPFYNASVIKLNEHKCKNSVQFVVLSPIRLNKSVA